MTTADLREAHASGRAAAAQFRLPFTRKTWRGLAGNWQGAGVGSSIDFQDHRPYVPGDDPRHINWQAYARTGHYTMKLFREEVSPHVDIALDVSSSMTALADKAWRTMELLYFCIEAAKQHGAALRIFRVSENRVEPTPIDRILGHQWEFETRAGKQNVESGIARVPWRIDSMRIVLSDLLFPTGDGTIFRVIGGERGMGIVLAPYSVEESLPDWDGNIEFVDVESGQQRLQRVTAGVLERYRSAYRRHFEMWREGCARRGILFAKISGGKPGLSGTAGLALGDCLRREGLPAGVVDLG